MRSNAKRPADKLDEVVVERDASLQDVATKKDEGLRREENPIPSCAARAYTHGRWVKEKPGT